MIALLRNNSEVRPMESRQQLFLEMLPQIRRQAALALRHMRGELQEDLVQEVIASAYCNWARLAAQGRETIARPTPLVRYALKQVRAGRRVGCRLNAQDVMSPYARRIRGFVVEPLERRDDRTSAWSALLVEDRRSGPAETAAARIDLADWLRRLAPRTRRIAKALALGETTKLVAQRFQLTPGRISQLRAWLRMNWEQFQSANQWQDSAI